MNKAYASRMLGYKYDIAATGDDGCLYLGNENYAVKIEGGQLPDGITQRGADHLAVYQSAFKKLEDSRESNMSGPSIADIEAACKGYKSSDPVKYDFRELNPRNADVPRVKMMYLRNVLAMFSKKEDILYSYGGGSAPLFLWQGFGKIEAIIFPIRRLS